MALFRKTKPQGTSMLTVHHLANSQSERIVWLCEELGLEYRLVRYERDASGRAPAELKGLHPFGTAPVITDSTLVLGESGAIIEYIIAKHGGGRLAITSEQPGFADYLYWFHFANASFMPTAMMDYAIRALGVAESETTRQLRWRGERAFRISEDRLGQVPYFAGESFTAADIMMVLSLKSRRNLSAWPNIEAYLKRIRERPAYQRAMSKAEPDQPPA